MVVSLVMLGPGVAWQPYSEEKVEQATEMGKPVIIDFYADWCAPCRDLDRITFHDPEVVEAAKSFSMLKVDLTRKGDPLHEVLLNRYEVRGVPTVVFLGPDGKEVKSLRVLSFEKPEVFLEKMNHLQQGLKQAQK
jgi:thiol:disulfide interchange protein DsbD